MNHVTENPLIVVFFFILRCMVPLAIMLGISYLLKRFGLIAPPPPTPPEYRNGNDDNNHLPNNHNEEGGLAHGKV